MPYVGRAIAVVGWLVAFLFVASGTVAGLRGGPLRLPFRGGAGQYILNGNAARVAGVLYLLLALLMLALPVLLVFQRN